MRKILLQILHFKLHIIASIVLVYFFLPIAQWYLNFKPLWGVDFFLTATNVNLLRQNFVLPFAYWNYGGFEGWPLFTYPFLQSYFIYFFTFFYSLVYSIQLWMMISTAIFILGAYYLFFVAGRSIPLAIILAIATAFSAGVYQTLTWAGSMPSYATQAAYPWAFAFLVKYYKTRNLRYFLTSALIAGVSALGHPLVYIVYILPTATIFMFSWFAHGFKIVSKFKHFFLYFVISLLIGLPQFYFTFQSSLRSVYQPSYKTASSTTAAPPSQTQLDIAGFNKKQFDRVFTDNSPTPFYMIAVTAIFFLLSFIIGRKKYSIAFSIPFLMIAGYFTFYIWLFGQGISIYHGGWYRLFWSVPIWVGALCACFWGLFTENISYFFKSRTIRYSIIISLNVVVFLIGALILSAESPQKVISKIIYRSQTSSSHPDVMNLKVTDQERDSLKSSLVPQWLNPDNTNFRLYDADQTVNIWWNSLFKMPLSRGYLDSPADSGYTFWVDAALSESEGEPQLVKAFKFPQETAMSNALFLIDWYGVKYFEGGHEGDVFTPWPKYLKDLVKQDQIVDLNQEKFRKRNVFLHFYELKDELVSPVLSATNAPVVGIFASDGGYEAVIRSIAERDGLNSQKIIPLRLGKKVDDYDLKTLKQFSALYLYDYDYKSSDNTMEMLNAYMQTGKKVFVETGVEVKQSAGETPAIFPVRILQRKGMGKEWSLEGNPAFSKDIDLKQFAPPIFDNAEWNVSFGNDTDLRENSTVILKNQGRVIIASKKVGSGELIWSGMNLAYHVTRNHNLEEAKFNRNILSELIDFSSKPQVAKYQVKFVNANNREISAEGAKGILFKEQDYPGWSARMSKENGQNQNLTILNAGPANPGFMYIPLPDTGSITVKLKYTGSFVSKVIFGLSFLVWLFVLEWIILRGVLLGRPANFVKGRIIKMMKKWWEKEDEV